MENSKFEYMMDPTAGGTPKAFVKAMREFELRRLQIHRFICCGFQLIVSALLCAAGFAGFACWFRKISLRLSR
jgi:hypothetical protein